MGYAFEVRRNPVLDTSNHDHVGESASISEDVRRRRIGEAARCVAEKMQNGVEPSAIESAIARGNLTRTGMVILGHPGRITTVPKEMQEKLDKEDNA